MDGQCKEYYSKEAKQLLQDRGEDLHSTANEEKSRVVERWNRTTKERMFKYFTANSTRSYLPILDDLDRQYYNTRPS